MSKPQWGETGKSEAECVVEATEIILKLVDSVQNMLPHESKFITDMAERIERYGTNTHCSPKQLFWLRDLLEKYQ